MRQMAFWADTRFPYVKYGEITQAHAGGSVSVEGKVERVDPEFILPLAKGKELSDAIAQNISDYEKELAYFHQSCVMEVGKLLQPYIDTKEFFTIGKLKP